MKKQLIYKNETLIKETIQDQEQSLELLRDVNKSLAAIKADLSIDDLTNLVRNVNHHETYFTDFIKDHLLVKMGDQNFNGIAIKKEKLLEMIDVPDFKDLKNIIYQADVQRNLNPSFFGKDENGEVYLKSDYKDQIESRYTYYTENEAGNKTLNLLQAISAKLIEFRKLVNPEKNSAGFVEVGKVKGMSFDSSTGEYLYDINFIREQEQMAAIN